MSILNRITYLPLHFTYFFKILCQSVSIAFTMQQKESDVHLYHEVQDSPHSRRWWPIKALCMRIVYIVKGEFSIPLRISKTTTLSPMRNSRTLAAVAKMCFTLKRIYNNTTMRNTQRKYSFLFLVCMHVNNLCLTSTLNYIPFLFLFIFFYILP